MPTRNGEYSVVGLSDNWTVTSVEDAEVASVAAPAMVLPLTKVP